MLPSSSAHLPPSLPVAPTAPQLVILSFALYFCVHRSPGEAQLYFDEADSCLRTFEQQTKEIEKQRRTFDHESKTALDRKLKTLQREFAEEKQNLTDARAKQQAGNMNAAQQAEWREQRMRLLESRGLQDSTTSSLQRTQRTIDDATVVSADTGAKLETQTEQMEHMRETLKETDGVLDRSRNLLRRMRRRLVTSKMITVIILMLELGILGLIIYIKYYS